MLNYIYDGSFEGLLTAIYDSYKQHKIPDNILPSGIRQQSFFDTNINITSDSKKAEKVFSAVREKICGKSLEVIVYIFLSEVNGAGNIIFQYLSLGFKIGSKVNLHMSDDRVLKAHNIWRKVAGEKHRILGLIRFRKLKGGVYYAPIEPDYNILSLIAPHFTKRMADQDFIIHDVKRDMALLYNKGKWFMTNFVMGDNPAFEEDESLYQQLWKQYFNDISIKSKVNPQLQKRCMPVRYWKYLTEIRNDIMDKK